MSGWFVIKFKQTNKYFPLDLALLPLGFYVAI
jgi:hypothetical protein